MAEQKRRFGCLSIAALLFLIGVGVNAVNSFRSAPGPSQEQVQETQTALPVITLDEAIKQYENSNLTDFAIANCTLFDTLDFEEASSVKYSIEGSWGQALKTTLIENCEKGTSFTEIEEKFLALKFEVNRVRTLYANLPWYPDGFELFDTNIAYKLAKGRGCDYFDCWNYDVVTKVSCSSLYVEMNMFDSSGAIIGFTNDSARNVSAGQVVKMRFDDPYGDATSGRITEMSCY